MCIYVHDSEALIHYTVKAMQFNVFDIVYVMSLAFFRDVSYLAVHIGKMPSRLAKCRFSGVKS